MKPQPLTLLCLALLAFALSACKKSSNPKPAAANTISLTFKGTVYTTSDIVASMRHDTLEMVANFSSGIATTMYIVNPAAAHRTIFRPARPMRFCWAIRWANMWGKRGR